MKKTLEEITTAVDNRIQQELRFVNEENEKIRTGKLTKAYSWLYKLIPKRSYNVENDLYLRGIAIVLLRSKIIKAVYENGLDADDCLSGNIIEYILPSPDCKAKLQKADSAVIPTAGSAADCKWVLIAYLWIMKSKGTRIILQGDVWKKARMYFIRKIREEKRYSEFLDTQTSYESLVGKYDLFADELSEIAGVEESNDETANALIAKLEAIESSIRNLFDKEEKAIRNEIATAKNDAVKTVCSNITHNRESLEKAVIKSLSRKNPDYSKLMEQLEPIIRSLILIRGKDSAQTMIDIQQSIILCKVLETIVIRDTNGQILERRQNSDMVEPDPDLLPDDIIFVVKSGNYSSVLRPVFHEVPNIPNRLIKRYLKSKDEKGKIVEMKESSLNSYKYNR